MTEAPPIHVVFALLPGSLILDWAGPAEALRIANQCLRTQGRAERFLLRFAGPQPETASSVGAQIAGLLPLARRCRTTLRPAPGWCWSACPASASPSTPRRPARCCTGCAACAWPAAGSSC